MSNLKHVSALDKVTITSHFPICFNWNLMEKFSYINNRSDIVILLYNLRNSLLCNYRIIFENVCVIKLVNITHLK